MLSLCPAVLPHSPHEIGWSSEIISDVVQPDNHFSRRAILNVVPETSVLLLAFTLELSCRVEILSKRVKQLIVYLPLPSTSRYLNILSIYNAILGTRKIYKDSLVEKTTKPVSLDTLQLTLCVVSGN